MFNVVAPSTLVFNPVDGAERYYITISCGDSLHQHTKLALGNSTYYNFSNCAMSEDGISFTVYAEADEKLTSESRAFIYKRELAQIQEFAFDAATETLIWDAVPDATGYVVSVLCGDATHNHEFVNIGNKTSYCLKECTAREEGIIINVYPCTKGYISPVAATYVYEKTTLAAPHDIRLEGQILSWTAVNGATSYTVRIGNQEYSVDTNRFDLSNAAVDIVGSDYSIYVWRPAGIRFSVQ